MDADDFFQPNLIKEIEKLTVTENGVKFGKARGFSFYLNCDGNVAGIKGETIFIGGRIELDLLLAGGLSGMSGTFIKRELCPKFYEGIRILEDYLFYITAFITCGSCFGLPNVHYYYFKNETYGARRDRYRLKYIKQAHHLTQEMIAKYNLTPRLRFVCKLYLAKNKAYYSGSRIFFVVFFLFLCILSKKYFIGHLHKRFKLFCHQPGVVAEL